MKKQRTSSIDLKRAASICCQCNTCTDLCPRNNLGHPIDPARFMRAAANGDFRDLNPYLDSHFCSSCGVCEMYACPQSLAPRTLLADMKGGLRKAGIRPAQGVQPVPVQQSREYRKVPEERLMARLGLTKYDKDAPMDETLVAVPKVKILLSQHIGAPAQAIVKAGDEVIAATGAPYDTMQTIIGVPVKTPGSLTDLGVVYKEIPMIGSQIDLEKITAAITAKTKMIHIQRSCGYSSVRKTLRIEEIGTICKAAKAIKPDIICFVDNCYGEFIEKQEPTEVGADLMAGSLIKTLEAVLHLLAVILLAERI